MIYNFQLNRILADSQCRIADIAYKASIAMQKGKQKCAEEHIMNLNISKTYYDQIRKYVGFDFAVNSSFRIEVLKENAYEVVITLSYGGNSIIYQGTDSESVIIDYFKEQLLLDSNISVYRDSSNSLIFYSSCNYESDFTIEKLNVFDKESKVSIDVYNDHLCEILNTKNCLTTCEINCIIEDLYCLLNKYCNEC